MSRVSKIDWLTSEKANILSRMFGLTVKRGYDSEKFVKKIMTCSEMSNLMNVDERTEWCDEHFLLAKFLEKGAFEFGKTIGDSYPMEWLGFLYKYWMRTRNLTALEVYKLYSYDRFLACYPFHHTQDWDFVIEDVMRNNSNYIY